MNYTDRNSFLRYCSVSFSLSVGTLYTSYRAYTMRMTSNFGNDMSCIIQLRVAACKNQFTMMAGHTALPVLCLLLIVVPLVSTQQTTYRKLDDDTKAADEFELMTVQNVSSSIQCAGRCTRTKHCNTYSYCKNTRTCQLARPSANTKFDTQLQPASGFKVYSSGK